MQCVRVPLDGRVRSHLEWSEAVALADKSERVIFDLNLGLFQGLIHPLNNSTQYLSLKLSIDHFLDFLYPQFKDKMEALCLWKGSTHFAKEMRWNEEQETLYQQWKEDKPFDDVLLRDLYAKQVIADYLHLLTAHLPDEIHARIDLKIEPAPFENLIFLCSPEPFDRISLAFTPDLFPKDAPLGLLVPPLEQAFDVSFKALERKTFRLIPEEELVGRWDGLDQLYILHKNLSTQGKRMVQGFQAAGGEVI